MKCPRCGLVHTPADQVCRRCEIDLRTGEPRPRFAPRVRQETQAAARPKNFAGFAAAIKERLPGRKPLPETAPALAVSAPAAAAALGPKRAPEVPPSRIKQSLSFITRKDKKGESLPAHLKHRIGELIQGKAQLGGVQSITCARCTSPMTIEKNRPFNSGAPIALIALGAILFLAGLRYHLLFITAVLSITAGVLYMRVGRTFWKCTSCGFTVPRA